jgi:hypothetical protein
MDVDQVKEYLHSIESSSQSYSDLLEYECLLEIKGRWPDDNGLNDIFYSLDHSKLLYWQKLRGEHDTSEPKLADRYNDSEFCHGYVLFIDKYDSKSIEKELIVPALRGDITFKKIDVSLIKADIVRRNEEHFNALFEFA